MSEREHERMPYVVQVEFRTASSFLVAYSVNLSRGGLFLETDARDPERRDRRRSRCRSRARRRSTSSAWCVAPRRRLDAEGPPGLGIEFQDIGLQLGMVIDQLVGTFHGVQVLVLSGDRQDRTTLARSIKSIITTAEIMQAADASVAAALMTSEVDLAVVDIDFDQRAGSRRCAWRRR